MTVHVGDYGTLYTAVLTEEDGSALDCTLATEIVLLFQRRSGDVLQATGALKPGTINEVQYTFQQGDITVKGKWKVQATVTFANGHWHSDLGQLDVAENISVPAP